ncbi:MAG TPA: histidinol-phosphate transaminase [Actinomycetota bacterium]|jgi:histidinol-phosphate aminotransferase
MTVPEPRPGLRDVEPYDSPQVDAPVRLNTNECPYPLPKGFRDDLADAVRALGLNRYPDTDAMELRQRLAAHTGHDVEGTWAANGSNEIIHQLSMAYGGPGRKALLFPPTYALHQRIWTLDHGQVTSHVVHAPFVLREEDVDEAVELDPDAAFVCSPNNPTGNAHPRERVERLASETDALVIVDEAYVEFGGDSAAPLIARHPNVVVVRTFSKAFALAGARVGYCLADPDVVENLRRVRLPYHLSALTQAAGLTALAHLSEATAILDDIRKQRDRMFDRMSVIPGVEPFHSDANFILFETEKPAAEVWQALLDRGVLVRDLTHAVPRALRVSAGTEEETTAFLDALDEVT